MIGIYGSAKESSGSTPSESDGGSSGISSSGSSGSEYCSWEIIFVVLYDPLTGEFFVNNTGTLPLIVVNVTIPLSYTLTPPTPVVIAAGASAGFTVVSDTDDLSGVTVTVTTDCGDQSFVF